MITVLKNGWKLIKTQGLNWLLFRIGYWVRRQSGILRIQMPAYSWQKFQLTDRLKPDIPSTHQSYAIWRKQNLPAFFFTAPVLYPEGTKFDEQAIISSAKSLLNGKMVLFSHLELEVDCPPDWLKDPITGTRYQNNVHWSKIPDYGNSDIKFLWEINRFSNVFYLMRANAVRPDPQYAETFWSWISSWMKANPPGSGPNWKDGQEIALRVMATCFGYYAFLNSPSTTAQDIAQFTLFIAAHAERIWQNLDFAIHTHSNHTISEAFGLWFAGTLFPELENAARYERIGRKLLEAEARSQFFADGSYSMYSLNYQRFVMHLYLMAFRLADIHSNPFSASMREIFGNAITFFQELIEPSSGAMPRFGSDDGALLLPLNQCDYNDFRPILQAGYYLVKNRRLFGSGAWDEDMLWLFGEQALLAPAEREFPQKNVEFSQAGVSIIRQKKSHAVIRHVQFQSRPSHADQLHVDLWWHGKNLFLDAGTYLYNGEGIWKNALAHTSVHNTVTVDQQDQMQQVSRITWVDWAKASKLPVEDCDGLAVYPYLQEGYYRLPDPVRHERRLIPLNEDRWMIIDRVLGTEIHHFSLNWLLPHMLHDPIKSSNGLQFELNGHHLQFMCGSTDHKEPFSIVAGDAATNRGWRSQYYAQKEPALSLTLEGSGNQIIFWSYLGYQDDVILHSQNSVNISTASMVLNFDLQNNILQFTQVVDS